MGQLTFLWILTALLALMSVACVGGQSPSASEKKNLISSTKEAKASGKAMPPAMTKPPKPRKVRVVSLPKRRLGLDEAEQFTEKALDLLAPFQISDIATTDLGGAITWTPFPKGGIKLGEASKTRDDKTTVTLFSQAREKDEKPLQVIVYHKTGNIASIDLKKDKRGERVLAFISPNTHGKGNRLRFDVVMIYEQDGDIEHQYVYLMDLGVWSYEVYKYELRN